MVRVRPRRFGCSLDFSSLRQAKPKCWVLTHLPSRKRSGCEVAPCLNTPVSMNDSQWKITWSCTAESGNCLQMNGAVESNNYWSPLACGTDARRSPGHGVEA